MLLMDAGASQTGALDWIWCRARLEETLSVLDAFGQGSSTTALHLSSAIDAIPAQGRLLAA